jgi:hypothetical protein
MSLRLGALEDALVNAGADKVLAQKAAEELADYERQVAAIRTDLAVLKWMVGTNVAVSMATLWKVFS